MLTRRERLGIIWSYAVADDTLTREFEKALLIPAKVPGAVALEVKLSPIFLVGLANARRAVLICVSSVVNVNIVFASSPYPVLGESATTLHACLGATH